MDSLGSTPSPNKRSTFRSKTKQQRETGTTQQESRQMRSMPSFYVYLKQFPLDTNEEVLGTVRAFELTHTGFLQNLQNLKLYKPNLAAMFEENWRDFMELLRIAMIKLTKRTERVAQEKQRKIAELLSINRELEKEQQKWKERIQKLQELRELQSAQLSMADTELQMVNGEMRDIYKVLQGDMGKVSTYLTRLEERRAASDEEGSAEIYSSLKTLSLLLNNMETEQRSTNTSLSSMRELIKAMTKCTKVSTSTQVDQSELLTKAGAIFSNASDGQMPFNLAQASSINFGGAQTQHIIDRLKQREQTQPHDRFKLEKHADKPWALTPTLLSFLENMSKENESGKVLPWQYTKQLIAQIYEQRGNYQLELTAGGIGNGMLFDEFVVFYFLHKHRIRRLAEVKLLEFMVSLKYYCKYWQRAETFCQLMDVMRYQPPIDPADSFNYRLDYNTQNFFFAIYKKIVGYPSVQEEGSTLVQSKQVKKLMRASLFFTDQMSRSRMLARLDKDLRSIEKIDHCDFDYAMGLFLDEYLSCKKKICGTLNRAFSRKFQANQGYFSLDEVQDLFQEMEPIYRTGSDMQSRYPIDSKLQLAKLYLYTATSGNNSYDFNVNHFITACQRYGFDAPFPFLHVCSKKQKHYDEASEAKRQIAKQASQEQASFSKKDSEVKESQSMQDKHSVNLGKQRIDIGVKMFSQHFGILRELRSYVDIFANTLKDEKNPDVLWKSFGQIKTVLQRGCEFMRYPLLNSKE